MTRLTLPLLHSACIVSIIRLVYALQVGSLDGSCRLFSICHFLQTQELPTWRVL